MNRLTLVAASLMFAFSPFGLNAQRCNADELMSPQLAARLGLEEAWRRQTSVPAGVDSIVDQQIIVHEANPREYVEVVGKAAEGEEKPVLFRIPTDLIGPDGQPIGKEEAERLARREVRRLARRGVEPTITSIKVPRVQLYTASNNGVIDCRDAETGTPIWLTQVGNPRLTYGKMGIDDKYVTITNGGNLEKIDVVTGEPINSVRTTSMPLYGAIHAGDYSLVPTIRNGVEGYPLDDTTRDPFMEIVSGLALEPPTKSPTSSKIAWGTDRGFVYVMELSGEPSVLFRLNTDGIVSGKIVSAAGDRFFFASEGGQVYCVKATRTGDVLWSKPYGEPFYDAGFLIKGMLLIPSTYGHLHALDEATGQMAWSAPARNVDEVLGASDDHVYVRMLSGGFGVIDVNNGQFIEVVDSMRPTRSMINVATDRLYFVNSIGTVQCLRPIGEEMPTIRTSVEPSEEPAEETGEQPEKPAGKPAPADPFGAGASDPFGGGGNDPFGGGAGGNDAPMEDPFGSAPAGNDPFGADPFGN